MNTYRNSLLEVQNISKNFGSKKVLDNISIQLNPSEIVSIVGESGSGKSTLFNIIAGLIKPDSGKVLLMDRDITGKMGEVAYMLQKDLLLKHLTILDNVSLPLVIKGMPKSDAREKAAPYFSSFGLSGWEDRYPNTLSGGMSQRAALLRTYMISKELTLLDEPFSALDAITRASIHNWYLKISRELNLSTLFITHDIEEAIKLSDRIYILARTSEILEEIKIDKRGNSIDEFLLTKDFLEYKSHILSLLKKIIV